jgi:hypothetical protein
MKNIVLAEKAKLKGLYLFVVIAIFLPNRLLFVSHSFPGKVTIQLFISVFETMHLINRFAG